MTENIEATLYKDTTKLSEDQAIGSGMLGLFGAALTHPIHFAVAEASFDAAKEFVYTNFDLPYKFNMAIADTAEILGGFGSATVVGVGTGLAVAGACKLYNIMKK